MDEVDKQGLIKAVTECRMTHTVGQYIDKKTDLLDLGEGVYVKPGRTKKAVLFNEYFLEIGTMKLLLQCLKTAPLPLPPSSIS